MLIIHERLCEVYHCPIPYFSDSDPVSDLIGALLSHRTLNRDSAAAMRNLRSRFSTWDQMLEVPAEEIERQIPMVRWPEMKAPRLQSVLGEILSRRGELSLDFLAQMDPQDALAWLEGIKGVGPKTAAATISFSRLRMRALAVDSHHHRVAQRLALIPPKMGEGPAHRYLVDMLPEEWTPQQVYDDHEIFMLHGQKICHWRKPACDRCVLADICPSAFKVDAPAKPDPRAKNATLL
ncbi:Fe-S cluster assembly protein HesB [bacterium]|nr:MAG: Fe-S cluster assembly protein HesB [bacterium]